MHGLSRSPSRNSADLGTLGRSPSSGSESSKAGLLANAAAPANKSRRNTSDSIQLSRLKPDGRTDKESNNDGVQAQDNGRLSRSRTRKSSLNRQPSRSSSPPSRAKKSNLGKNKIIGALSLLTAGLATWGGYREVGVRKAEATINGLTAKIVPMNDSINVLGAQLKGYTGDPGRVVIGPSDPILATRIDAVPLTASKPYYSQNNWTISGFSPAPPAWEMLWYDYGQRGMTPTVRGNVISAPSPVAYNANSEVLGRLNPENSSQVLAPNGELLASVGKSGECQYSPKYQPLNPNIQTVHPIVIRNSTTPTGNRTSTVSETLYGSNKAPDQDWPNLMCAFYPPKSINQYPEY